MHIHENGFNPEAPVFIPLAEIKMRAEAAEFIPMYGGLDTLHRAAEAFQAKQQKRQMPPATDEEWEMRIAKREKEVATIKSLQSYRLYREVFPNDDDPKTPDPRDRTVSKRMWKWNVEKWRLQLKGRCVYSRAATLQCREYVLRKEKEGITDDFAEGGEDNSDVEEREVIHIPGVLRTKPIELCPGFPAASAVDVQGAPPGIPVQAGGLPIGAGKFH